MNFTKEVISTHYRSFNSLRHYGGGRYSPRRVAKDQIKGNRIALNCIGINVNRFKALEDNTSDKVSARL